MVNDLPDHATKQGTPGATKFWTRGSTIAGTKSHQWSTDRIQENRPEVIRQSQMSSNEASSGQKKVNKRSRVKQKGEHKVAGGKTKSIHDNLSDKDD